MTRNQIAQRIIQARNENTFAEFVRVHPETTGVGTWRYSCDISGWHSYTTEKAMDSFGRFSNLAWRVAGRNTVSLAELLEYAAKSADEEATEAITKQIKKEERKNPGTICETVKEACNRAGITFRRSSLENQFSTNLVFVVGEHRVRFDYCGGAMMKVACGATQLMGLVAAFVKTQRGVPQYKAPANGGYPMSAFARA